MTEARYKQLERRYEAEKAKVLKEEAKKIAKFRQKYPDNPLGKIMESIQENSIEISKQSKKIARS